MAALAWPLGVATAWAVLALRSPTVTYHLAPLVAAAAAPVALRLASRDPLPAGQSAVAAGAGLGITLVTAGILARANALGGPSLWHGRGALETPLLAVVGALWGWRAASRRRAGLLGLLR